MKIETLRNNKAIVELAELLDIENFDQEACESDNADLLLTEFENQCDDLDVGDLEALVLTFKDDIEDTRRWEDEEMSEIAVFQPVFERIEQFLQSL